MINVKPVGDSSLPTVTNKAEFDALPGDSFFMQDGQKRYKPKD